MVEKESERSRLAERVDRLTRCVLDSTAALSHLQRRLQQPGADAARAAAAAKGRGCSSEAWRERGPEAEVVAAVMAVRGAGELFAGECAIGACAARTVEEGQQVEANVLRRQVIALADGAHAVRRGRICCPCMRHVCVCPKRVACSCQVLTAHLTLSSSIS